MRHDLTDALIRALRAPEGGRLEVWDRRCEGLVLRVSDQGRVTFHARARGADGRKRFAGLGTWPSLSLAQARMEARVTIGLMQKGNDPTAERREAREARVREAAMLTLRELGQAWATAHARDTSSRYRSELLATIDRGCGDDIRARGKGIPRGPELLARRIDTVTVGDIAGVVQAARARGDGEARHLVRGLRRLFSFALASGHLQASVVDEWLRREKGGRRSIPWMRDGIRERVLNDTELAKLWTASGSLDATARVFTRLLLLTACRSGEISGLAWREIEREAAAPGVERITALVLPPARTKNRRGHRVPLASIAVTELEALALSDEGRFPQAELVFPGVVSRTAGICRALRQASGVLDWTWHDLRRSAATTMARIGCPREHVEAALNHISTRGGLTGIYQRYDYDREAAEALRRWQAHVAGLAGGHGTDHTSPCGASMIGRIPGSPGRRRTLVTKVTDRVSRTPEGGVGAEGASVPDTAEGLIQGQVRLRRKVHPPQIQGSPSAGAGEPDTPRGFARGLVRIRGALPSAQKPETLSSARTTVTSPSDENVPLENSSPQAILKEVSPRDLELAESAVSPAGRRKLRRIRAVSAATTRPAYDDDDALLRIEQHLRANPGISTAKAVRFVVSTLPPAGDNRSGGRDVRLSGRVIAEASAIDILTRKFRKHRSQIVRRVDSQELGLKIARPHIGLGGGWRGLERLARIQAAMFAKIADLTPAELERGRTRVAELSLPDATDALYGQLFPATPRGRGQ